MPFSWWDGHTFESEENGGAGSALNPRSQSRLGFQGLGAADKRARATHRLPSAQADVATLETFATLPFELLPRCGLAEPGSRATDVMDVWPSWFQTPV